MRWKRLAAMKKLEPVAVTSVFVVHRIKMVVFRLIFLSGIAENMAKPV